MPRPSRAKTLFTFVLVSAVFTALISPVSAASINYSSSSDWDSGIFEDTRSFSDELLLGYGTGVADDVDTSDYSDISPGDTSSGEYIDKVEVNGISYESGNNGGYLDATNQTSNAFVPGEEYTISVTLSTADISGSEYASVAFDWNNNQDLSDDEVYLIGSCSKPTCTVSSTFEVPEKIPLNNSVLMRVLGSYGDYDTNPTESTYYNENEDYSAYVPGYTSSGSYSTDWINTDRLASWHNITYRTNMSPETYAELNVSVSDDASKVQDSSSFPLEDGNNTLDITQLESAQYVKLSPNLSTTNVEKTPEIEGLQINHKLINITSKSLSNYSDQHKFDISAVADHPNGSESFSSCKVYITDNKDLGNYQKITSIGGSDPSLDKTYGGQNQSSCNATVSQDLNFIDLEDNLDYYFEFTDKDGVKRVTEEMRTQLPNRRPEINSTSFEASNDKHSFNFSAVGYDIDEDSSEIKACTVYAQDSDGNTFSGGVLNRSGGGIDQAFCNATVSSSDGFDPGEPLDIWAEFTDRGSLTGSSNKVTGEVPNHRPSASSIDTFPDEAGHSFDIEANFTDTDGEQDLTNGKCRVYLTDGESSVTVGSSDTTVTNKVTDDEKVSCNYNVDASLSDSFSVGEEIEAKVEFEDEWGKKVNSSAELQNIPNNEPDLAEALSFDVGNSSSVVKHKFNISFTNPGDPDGDDLEVKAYVGSSDNPSFVENSISLSDAETGEISDLLIGNSTQLSDGEKYFIELESCDSYGLCNSTRVNSSFLMNEEPQINDAGSSVDPLTLSEGDETSISANITDLQSEVQWAYFEVKNVTGGDWTQSTNRTLGDRSGDFWNSTTFQVSNNTNYEWSLTASDGFETSSTSGSFGTGETPPIIDNLSLQNIAGEHSFTVNANISDSDGADTIDEATVNISDGDGNRFTYSPEIITNIGNEDEAYIKENTVNNSIQGFEIGETVDVELKLVTINGTTATKSMTKKIPNRPPEVTDVKITPQDPETNEIIEASYIISDPEGDELPTDTRNYQWFMDGSYIPITGKTVDTSSTEEGQIWNVSVQVQDEYGATSNTKYADTRETITNSIPEISQPVNTENLGDHRFEASAVARDANGQEDFTGCTLSVEQGTDSKTITPDQDLSFGSTQEIRCSAEIGPSTADWIEPTEEINITFSFSDDQDGTATTEMKKTVPNQRPSIDLLSPLDKNFSSSSVTFDWEMSDSDGDSLSASIEVFNESKKVWSDSNIPTSSVVKSLDDSEYTWEVTVSDSYDSITLSSKESTKGSFIVDSTAPELKDIGASSANGTDKIDQNDSLKIYSKWNDSFDLGDAKVYENLTETNHSISAEAFEDGWSNHTVNASDVEAGTVSYTVYAFDHLGNMRKESKTVQIEDIEKPEIREVSFTPKLGDQASYDPRKTVNVEASIFDNLKVSNTEIQYRKNTSDTWKSSELSKSGETYSESFTPSDEGLYEFSVVAEDSYGNKITKNFTQSIEIDLTWTTKKKINGSSTFTENQIDFKPFKVENTGDKKLEFSSSIIKDENLSLTSNLSDNFSIASGENTWVDINASTSVDEIELANLSFSIGLNASNDSKIAEPASKQIFGNAIFTNGPLVKISKTSDFKENVEQGGRGVYTFNLSNIGEAPMNSSEVEYSLPNGWNLINSDDTVSEIAAKGSNSIELVAGVAEDAETGEQTIEVTITNSNYSFSNSFQVTVNKVEEEDDTTVIEEPSGGGGGFSSAPSGGGGDRIPEGTSDKILQSSSSFELVRGQDQNFTINFTNPTEYNLSNISVEASGFRAQYLDLQTEEIGSLEVNESRPITVGIAAPDFFASQSFDLEFTISGKGYDSEAVIDPYFNFTLNKVVSLEIKEISRTEAENLTERMEKLREKMEGEGLPARDVNQILSESEESIEQGNYGDVRENFEVAQSMYNTGSETSEELETLREQVETAQAQGLSVSQSRRMMNLAEAALNRGAFETASNRLDEAQNLYQLETKGEVNYIYLITSNWMKILGGLTVLWIVSLLGYYRFRLYRINSRLEELENREQNIREMKIQDQKKAFEEQSMSLNSYEDAVDGYNQELIDLIEERTELQSMKANITNLKREESLRQERDKLKQIIDRSQEDYVKGDIADTAMYETKVEELTEKLSAVESELAEIEAKSKKNNRKLQLKVPEKWKEKLKALF